MKALKSIGWLSAGHFFLDSYSSMLGAFLPFLTVALGLTLTQAGLLGGALIVSGSLLQPLYGFLADRFQYRIFVALGPAVAGVFISSMGLAPDFMTLLAVVLLGGVGIAAFHPQGTAVVTAWSGRSAGLGVSTFIASGMLGFSLGPILITGLIEVVGLPNSYWAALPGVAISIALLFKAPEAPRRKRAITARSIWNGVSLGFRPLLLLYLLVVIRSAVQMVFVSFLPLYMVSRGLSGFQGSQVLSLFLFSGALAGFFGGVLHDRIGGRRIILVSTIGFIPSLLGFLSTSGTWSLVFCALGGAFLLVTLSVNVIMAQRLAPEGPSTVSALMMGFGWGIGGVAVPLVGWLSDFYGLQGVLTALILLSSPALALAYALPATGRALHQESLREPSVVRTEVAGR